MHPENFKIKKIGDTEVYIIELDTRVAKSYARDIPISKEVYNDVQKYIKNKKIKPGENIFDKSLAQEALKLTGLREEFKKRGILPKLELITRKLVESELLSQRGFSDFGKTTVKAVMGHEKWSDNVYGMAASTKQKIQLTKNVRDLIDKKVSVKTFEQNIEAIMKGAKFQKTAVEIPESAKELREFIVNEIKKNPGVKVRILKNRYCGTMGVACHLFYNKETGRIKQIQNPYSHTNDLSSTFDPAF